MNVRVVLNLQVLQYKHRKTCSHVHSFFHAASCTQMFVGCHATQSLQVGLLEQTAKFIKSLSESDANDENAVSCDAW